MVFRIFSGTDDIYCIYPPSFHFLHSSNPRQNPLQDHPRNVAPQAGPWSGRDETLPRLRGNSGSLRQEKEARRSLGSARPQTPTSPQILRPRKTRSRGAL